MSSLASKLTISTLILALLYSNYERTLQLWETHLHSSTQHPTSSSSPSPTCPPHNYTTQILSLDPLLIYIPSFLTPFELTTLLTLGAPLFLPSQVHLHNRLTSSTSRTSSSAHLPLSPIVSCILARARTLMGTLLPPSGDFSLPQLVRYGPGEKFDLHHDWYATPQLLADGRRFNRPASFFVFLEANCTEGETWFPHIKVPEMERVGEEKAMWREREGGTAFRPVEGNAVFWVNLMPNGRGDGRVMHAGLPVGEGRKTGLNIWPRRFYE